MSWFTRLLGIERQPDKPNVIRPGAAVLTHKPDEKQMAGTIETKAVIRVKGGWQCPNCKSKFLAASVPDECPECGCRLKAEG